MVQIYLQPESLWFNTFTGVASLNICLSIIVCLNGLHFFSEVFSLFPQKGLVPVRSAVQTQCPHREFHTLENRVNDCSL